MYVFKKNIDGARRSAERVVPLVWQLLGPFESVVDLGGGSGAWLAEFGRLGASQITLFDSIEAERHLLIDRNCFRSVDLARELPEQQAFDLAICLECVEHLPRHRSEAIVRWLTSCSDYVLFSAAIPHQGGDGHINEQTPEYWRRLFLSCGFSRHDVLRGEIASDLEIEWWYRQNLFIFSRSETTALEHESDFIPLGFSLVKDEVLSRLAERPTLRNLMSEVASRIAQKIGFLPRTS